MSKTFVFAIGGTGSRVLRALTMLLAAGVKTDADEIVPIIIDPDEACGDKTDTVRIMNQYRELYDSMSHHKGKIEAFSAPLSKLAFPKEYFMPMGDNTNKTFGSYMEFGSLDEENRALVNMLFSESNQRADMTIGFTGNPNIGSVVLNQFTTSQEFQTFAASFQRGDKIFIVSSIFGGTGASGFPLLLKNLRHIDRNMDIPNRADIEDAEIGAVTVLPYFNIAPPIEETDNAIDSDTFISKAKSALSYYERNLTGLNVLYYIGDDERGLQFYNKGGATQQNKAHFVELASALAIIDFANNNFAAPAGSPVNTIYKEFGIDTNTTDITMKELSLPTRMRIASPLTRFTLFSKYLQEKLHSSVTQKWMSNYGNIMGTVLFNSLNGFTTSFLDWERGMEDNNHSRRFTPFVLDPRPGDVYGLAKGIKPKSVRFVSASNWDLADHYLNKGDTEKVANQHAQSPEGRFVAHLLYGIEQVTDDKISF